MWRLSARNFHQYMTEDSDTGDGSASRWLFALPMGFGEGLSQGLYYGPHNAIVNFDKPFSKASMSLEEVGPQQ